MRNAQRSAPPLALVAVAAGVLCPGPFLAQTAANRAPAMSAQDAASTAWDTAFQDRSGNMPVHFTAHYLDGHGQTHRLEEWRTGQTHLRRKTDDRIDLHADAAGRCAPGQPLEYLWQVLDLEKRIANRMSTAGMLHLGMLYSYYSMAHVLTRPAGRFIVHSASVPVPVEDGPAAGPLSAWHHPACTWWQIDAPGQASTRVCWLARYGVPAETWSQVPGGWRLGFRLDAVDNRHIARPAFVTDTAGFQVRSVDEMEAAD